MARRAEWATALVVGGLSSALAVPVAAKDSEGPPMPEPVIGETITDIDRAESGELELDLTGSFARARTGATAWSSSLEVEWGATEGLGLALETGVTFPPDTGTEFTGSAGVSYGLIHDRTHDFHLQIEGRARLWGSAAETISVTDPGDSTMRLAFGVRLGFRRGVWTLRAGLGAEAVGESAHPVPVWASLSGFLSFGPDGGLGFVGLDLDGNWARRAPLLLAPTVVFILGSAVSSPIRIGAAFPVSPGGQGIPASYGAILRFIYEPTMGG